MGETEWKALVARAQKIEKACKENSAEMESLKADLAEFKSKSGGGKTKKKGFWESLLGEEKEEENNDGD